LVPAKAAGATKRRARTTNNVFFMLFPPRKV
jgi:hypothetical protein